MSPNTVSDALIRATVQGSVAILAIYALTRVWQKCPHHVRCWLWRIALLKMLIAAVWLSPVTFTVLPKRVQPVRNVLAVKPPPSSPQQGYSSVEIGDTVELTPETAARFTAEEPKPEISSLPEPKKVNMFRILYIVWCLGFSVSLIGVFISFLRSKRLRTRCSPIGNPKLIGELETLCRQAGVRRVPELLASPMAGPLVVGLSKPAIILPPTALHPERFDETRMILAHEVAHIARHDLFWEILPTLARIAFFFNPLVYTCGYQASLAREMACDAAALKLTEASDSQYAKMLVDCVATGRASVSCVGMAEAYGALRARILSVTHPIRISRFRLAVIWVLTTITALTLIVPWMLMPPRTRALSSANTGKAYKDSYKGLSIIPGVYKLSWDLRARDVPTHYGLTRIDEQFLSKLNGRISSAAYYFDAQGFEVIVDKAHRNSDTYDTAYVFPEAWMHIGAADLKKAWRIPLSSDGNSVGNDQYTVDVRLGRGSASVVKRGELAIEVIMKPDGTPDEGSIDWRGGWYGKIQTTRGEFEVQARDEDRDGLFDGTCSWECTPGKGCKHGLDQFYILGLNNNSGLSAMFGEEGRPALGPGMFAGKLYNCKVSPAGNTVSIMPYKSRTGTVEFQAVDGFGRPAGFSAAFDSGKNSFVFSGQGQRKVDLPPGKYEVEAMVGLPNIVRQPDEFVSTDYPFTYQYRNIAITSGEKTRVLVGGKLTLRASAKDKSFTTRHGEKKLIKVGIAAPGVDTIYANWGPVSPIGLRITDSAGKLVRDTTMQWADSCTQTGQFDIGTLNPGDYTLLASYSFGAFSPYTSTSFKIKVTE